ncbi:MAG: MBL fold metallo-hydrolase [Candidatus Aminicenantes bacterium]|nr:MAG: MBL fold metallo-hydrolase [Candidatus Aminicenantes bacterium]
MKKTLIFAVAFFVLLSFANLCLHAKEVTFRWFGQGCFLIETSQNVRIITDPMAMGAYKIPEDIVPDIVTVSHEHFDHNQVDAVSGKPTVLRGLTSGGADFAAIDKKVKDIRVYTVPSYHDKSQGSQRGKNAIFVFEFDGIKVAHLGDLGDALAPASVQKIGEVDIVMIPVGGTYTIFGKEADHVISQLNPKLIVFPMHFKTDSASFLPYTGDDYTSDKQNVKKVDGNTFKLDLDKTGDSLTYVVLNYK